MAERMDDRNPWWVSVPFGLAALGLNRDAIYRTYRGSPPANPQYQNTQPMAGCFGIGAPERIRTSDLPLRRGPRYPAVPPGRMHKRQILLAMPPPRKSYFTRGSL